jgi:hypothetical protein
MVGTVHPILLLALRYFLAAAVVAVQVQAQQDRAATAAVVRVDYQTLTERQAQLTQAVVVAVLRQVLVITSAVLAVQA